MAEFEILHGVNIEGSFANTVAPRSVVDVMYPVWENEVEGGVYIGTEVEVNGVSMQPFNSILKFNPLKKALYITTPDTDGSGIGVVEGDMVAISGNTVTRLCPVAKDCGSCALSGSGMTIAEMSEMNCARANTAMAFETLSVPETSRLMLQPLSSDTFVLDDSHLTVEKTGDTIMQARLPKAESVVITESWLKSKNMTEFAIGMNGADGSFGIATMEVMGEKIFIPFCSMRGNMGDRGEDAQIIRRALENYLDVAEITGDKREQLIAGLKVSILIGASATLRNFAHKILVPEEGSKQHGVLLEKYPELVARAKGKVTSAIVLNDQYPGAFGRGSIFPQFEAEMGIHSSPITPDNCPGDGQTCHVDYRTETEYALRKQLLDMGVSEANIHYDDSQAMDPGDPTNLMASNRAEQLGGVKDKNKTNRTINGILVSLNK